MYDPRLAKQVKRPARRGAGMVAVQPRVFNLFASQVFPTCLAPRTISGLRRRILIHCVILSSV